MNALYVMFLSCVLPPAISKQHCYKDNDQTLICNYIPVELPLRVSRVIIQNFRKPDVNLVVNGSYFATQNWNIVKYLELSDESSFDGTLTLDASCFRRLQILSELHLHLADFILSPDAFVGTRSVRLLNMSSCFRLHMRDFMPSINGTDKLTNLQVLAISRLGHYRGPLYINHEFANLLQTKGIKELEIVASEIAYFDLGIFGYVKSLENLNIAYSQLGHVEGKRFNSSDLKSVKYLDFSDIMLPKTIMPPPGRLTLSNEYLTDERVINVVSSILTPISVNGSSILPKSNSIWIFNCTFPIKKQLHFRGREFVIKGNNLKYFDFRCINNSISSIEKVDVSDNGLQVITPIANSCFPRLKWLDLSNNQLFIMEKHNISLFAQFTRSFSYLKYISFSANNLQVIPYNMFSYKSALEIIDLSFNKLQQVTFNVEYLDKLKILDLRNNLIHILNDVSINLLNSIPDSSHHEPIATVVLASNNISCSTCDAKHFIRWILRTVYVNITSQHLKCLDSDGHRSNITEKTVKHLKHLCNVPIYIVLSCTYAVLSSLLIAALVYKVHKRRLIMKQKKHRNSVIERLRDGLRQFKYACYLVYSLEHGGNGEFYTAHRYMVENENIVTRDFVENCFIAPLDRTLKDRVGTERQLVCYDEDSDGGRSDFNVFFDNLALSATVLVIATEIFFDNALYCWMLEQVIAQGKQIIFFTEEGVTHQISKRETKRIFKHCKKFNWKVIDDELILKTSWSEVCTAILDVTCLTNR